MKPRFYQIEAVEATLDCLWNEPGENPLIAMPTGTGKAGVIGWLAKAILMRVPSARIGIPTHSKELVSQDAKTLQRIWPAAPYGIYSAGLGQKQSSMPLTFGNIQSMARNPKAFGKLSGIIVDEAHAIAPSENSMYQKFIADLRNENPDMFVAGLTATPYRLGQGLLTDGNIFTKFSYDVTGRKAFVRFIDMGYLSPLIPKATSFQFDISKVRMTAGDFNQKQLQEAVNVDELTYEALQESLQCASDRRHWMIFCAGIEHVMSVVDLLTMFGEDAVAVHSKMSEDERDSNIERFRQGRARMIVNDGVLTTGVDFPHVDCIVLLKPTSSPGLHVQILGRGTRPYYGNGETHMRGNMLYDQWGNNLDTDEGRLASIAMCAKQNCLVLDFSGNTERCGPINDPRIPKKKGKGTGEIPVKLCPKCDTYVHAAQRFCDGYTWSGAPCDHEFEFQTHLEQTAATTEIIVREDKDTTPVCEWFTVDRVEYVVKTKPFTPPMMQVKYFCGMRRFTQMVCIEHPTYAGKLARDWWRERDVNPPPEATHDGMAFVDNLKIPAEIYVHLNAKGGYQNILSVAWEKRDAQVTE
ncbi:hypothetical protein [Synechococcus phage Ssp-JY38]|nr:DNA repair helicase [Synechococcus phage Yong-L2-223]